MLKVFRDNLKYLSWVLWAVIIVFVLFVFVDFGATVPTGTSGEESAATVGDRRVSFGEYQNRYRQTEDFYREAYGEQFTPELAKRLRLELQVLEQLVNEKILLIEAERAGLAVTDGEVRRQILEYPAFQNEGGGFVGQDVYERILRSSGLSPDGFEQQVRRDLLVGKLRDVVAASVYVPASEVEEAYRERTERTAVRYLRLPADRFRDEVEVTDDEVEAWYQAHRRELERPEQRRVAYLLVDNNAIRGEIELSEEELRAAYEERREEFTREEQVRARHILLEVGPERDPEVVRAEMAEIRQRLEEGEEFAALARELSEDPGTAESGGDLGFFGRGRMVPEFEDAAFAAGLGEVVGPVETAFGLHLIEVIERREAGVRPFEEVRGALESRLLAERSRQLGERRAAELAERLRREGVTTPEAMEGVAAEAPAIELARPEAFARDDSVAGVGRAPAFVGAAFALAEESVSDPVPVPRGWAVLLLEEAIPPRIPELAEVADEVRGEVAGEKAAELARQRLAAARERVAGGEPLEEVAADLGLEVEESGSFGRRGAAGSLGMAPEVARLAFSLDEGELGGPLEVDGDALLFEVAERRRFDPDEFAEERDGTLSNLEQERVSELLAAIVERRRDELRVTYNPRLLETFEATPDQELG